MTLSSYTFAVERLHDYEAITHGAIIYTNNPSFVSEACQIEH